MLKLLVKKQMLEIYRSYFYDAKKNKKRSRGAIIGYITMFALLMVGMLGGIFTFLSVTLCGTLTGLGVGWLYFALMGLLAVFLGTFGSVFNTFSGLYLARDNDLLLSMPIPVRTLMAARLLTVYLMGLMYSAVVIVPAVIVYWVVASASVMAILGGVLLTVLISVFVLVLSCALGWIIAQLSLKLRHKGIITVIVSLIGVGLYYFVCFRASDLINALLLNAVTLGEQVEASAYPVYLFGRVGEGDGMAMLLVSLVVLVLFALMWYLLAKSFLKVVTSTGHTARTVYREKRTERRSVSAALLGKELARFTASPLYMLNCGLGILMLPIMGVVLLWKGAEAVSVANMVFGARGGCAEVLLCTGVCAIASMNDMATPSVSLEGKSLWLAQSLPVALWQVLRAKLQLQLVLTVVPALVPLVCMAVILPVTPALALAAVTALAYMAFSACLGLTLGVKRANFTWTSELAPIKQSLAVMIAMFGGWAYALVLAGLYLWQGWKLGASAYLALFALATLAAAAALYHWLKTKGAARFATL